MAMIEWIIQAEKELDEEEIAYLKEHGAKELVRCKDCKHRPKLLVTDIEDMESGFDLQFPDYKCTCRNDDDDWYSWYPSDDWFCAYGERK